MGKRAVKRPHDLSYNSGSDVAATVSKWPARTYTLDEARELLKQPVSQEELLQRQTALKYSDRFLKEMKPILGEDVKDWIRKED